MDNIKTKELNITKKSLLPSSHFIAGVPPGIFPSIMPASAKMIKGNNAMKIKINNRFRNFIKNPPINFLYLNL